MSKACGRAQTIGQRCFGAGFMGTTVLDAGAPQRDAHLTRIAGDPYPEAVTLLAINTEQDDRRYPATARDE